MSSSEPAPDPNLPDALAWAERRLAMLQQLAALGMRLADEVVERAVNAPYYPEARQEPGRAFASVSRAVRLTLVLEARIEADFFALRKGDFPPSSAAARARAAAPDRDVEHADPDDAEAGESGTVGRERTYERLVDREDDEAFLALPFDACVDAIRADLRSAVVPTATVADEAADESAATSLPFMGRVETKRSEVRDGVVSFTPEPSSLPQTSPPRSASPGRPSP